MQLKNSQVWKSGKIPCSGITTQGSVKSVAVINTIGCILCALMVTRDILTIKGNMEQSTESPETNQNSTNDSDVESDAEIETGVVKSELTRFSVQFHYLTWTLLYFKDVVDFIVSIFLFRSVSKRNLLYCKIYFLSTFLVLQAFTVYVIDTTLMREKFLFTVSVVIGWCFHLFYKPYSVWVVLNFMKVVIEEDKQMENKRRRDSRRLSDEELNDFYKGAKLLTPILETENNKLQSPYSQFTPVTIIGSPYLKNDIFMPKRTNAVHEAILLSFNQEYEVQLSDFTIDDTQVLGSGAFGTVYVGELQRSGKLLNENNALPLRIAVKTTKGCSNELDTEYFKALLDEVKVMSYVGQHANIVNIVGVCTAEIQNRKLWMLLELCEQGSLQTYLLARKHLFKPNAKATKSKEYITLKLHEDDDEDIITLRDMITWGKEISLGMEFLSKRKVCHGDLALRNILLTKNRHAKIADFGLSRKLYNYALYARNEETALPWKWMAPESLRNLTFSQSTDVWTYGVALWEIFSFGEEPWMNYEYSLEYIKQLNNGNHLSQPKICPNQMYAVMEACWNITEHLRPNFSRLVVDIDDILIATA